MCSHQSADLTGSWPAKGRTPRGSCPCEGGEGSLWALGGLGEGRGGSVVGLEACCSQQAYLGQCQHLTCLLCHFIKETCSGVCAVVRLTGWAFLRPSRSWAAPWPQAHVVAWMLHLSLGKLSLGHGEEEANADHGEQVRQVPRAPASLPHTIHPPAAPSGRPGARRSLAE